MGNLSIITKEQQIVLNAVKNNDYFQKDFYFTGGTALSEHYLHHRYSDDLDFFSEKKIDQETIFSFIQNLRSTHFFTFTSRLVEVVYIFQLVFPNGIELKVDFGYYPYSSLEKKENIDGLPVDSMKDIATNKLLTISQRTDIKDFVDIYFLLKKYSLWDLIYAVEKKFHTTIEPLLLASDFLKIEDFDFLPRLVIPLTLETIKEFFRNQAKVLGKKYTT